MARTRAALAFVAAAAVAPALVSGGSGADPRTPAALPGLPPPFLGTAVSGSGRLTAAVDAYGDVVDLRPGPAGPALIDNPSDRQAAGTVAADTGIGPWVRIDGGPALPFWRADSVSQRYLPGTNVVRTTARFGAVRASATSATVGDVLVDTVSVAARRGVPARAGFGVNLTERAGLRCQTSRGRATVLICGRGDPGTGSGSRSSPDPGSGSSTIGALGGEPAAARLIRHAVASDRAWLARARALGPGAPAWAQRMYARSLLTLRALTDSRTGAVAAGARDGWAHVWPRDAGTAALALAAAGYRAQARRVAGFLLGLDLDAAARFDGHGRPVPGRAAQGDASGWVAAAARAAGLPAPSQPEPWRDRPDYREGTPGTYLANAIASTGATASPVDGPEIRLYGGKSAHQHQTGALTGEFGTDSGLVHRAGDPASGLDSAAAWAVRPFPVPTLFPAVRETLLRLAATQTRFGITPGEAWPGSDPWSAPTAWSAWSFAALARAERRPGAGTTPATAARLDRRRALRMLAALHRAATPAGAIPERVDANTGIPRSTTPLAWSHAFAILALTELWPAPGVSELRPPPRG